MSPNSVSLSSSLSILYPLLSIAVSRNVFFRHKSSFYLSSSKYPSIFITVYPYTCISIYLSRYLEDDSPLAAEEEAAATKFLENVNKWRKANNREEVRTDDMYRIDGLRREEEVRTDDMHSIDG